MRIFVSLLATSLLLLGALPAHADGDLGNLLLIGDDSYGETDIAGAFKRLVDDGHFRVPTKELKKVVPAEIPDEQVVDLFKLSRVARERAAHWERSEVHDKDALALLTVVHDIATAMRKRMPQSVDAQLAYANTMVAWYLERINRRDRIKFADSFDAGAKVCLEAMALDKARAKDCAIEAAQILRQGVHRAGEQKHAVLDRAIAALDAAGADDAVIQTERARILLARSQLFLSGKKKGDAKEAALKALQLVKAGKEASQTDAVGAHNDLVAVCIENKWMPADTPFVMEVGSKGGFAFEKPTGSGWSLGNEGNLKGNGRFLLERRRPDGAWAEVGLASFNVELGYGEGDVPGSKPKAILQLTKQVLQGEMKKPKSGKLSKKGLPEGFEYVSGYTLTGRSRGNQPMTVFAWVCKSEKFTYVFSFVIKGKTVKKLPPQVATILASIRPE